MAVAQDTDGPASEAMLRAWFVSQQTLLSNLHAFEHTEAAEWTLDGPFNIHHMAHEAEVRVSRDTDELQRDLQSMHLDGAPVSPDRWEALQQRRRTMAGPELDALTRVERQLPRFLRALRVVGRATEESVHGSTVLRVELVPRNDDHRLERATLWFDVTQGHLYQSRLLVRRRAALPPFIITTTYTRHQGMDVPVARHIEGTVQTRRRGRTFTTLIDYRAQYSNHRLYFEGSG